MKIEALIFGLVLLIFGGLVMAWADWARKSRGLGPGKTLALDDLVLYSERLKIVGRPDRIVKQAGNFIPEEWKPSAKRVYHSHKLQSTVYCLLIEEKFGVRPPYGVVVITGGKRIEVPNSDELRAEVLAVAEKIREHRRNIQKEIPVRPAAAQCRACGQRGNCGQARDEM